MESQDQLEMALHKERLKWHKLKWHILVIIVGSAFTMQTSVEEILPMKNAQALTKQYKWC